MSMRSLLADSRKSGPATVYELGPDGVIASVAIRPARSVYKPGTLTPEEKLCILTETGQWPEDFQAEAWIGLQPGDGYPNPREGSPLYLSGIMSGFVDPTGQAGATDAFSQHGNSRSDPMNPIPGLRTEGLGNA